MLRSRVQSPVEAVNQKLFKLTSLLDIMQSKWYAWLVLLLGVLLILPKVGVTQLGDLTVGVISWLIPAIIIVIGIVGLVKTYGK